MNDNSGKITTSKTSINEIFKEEPNGCIDKIFKEVINKPNATNIVSNVASNIIDAPIAVPNIPKEPKSFFFREIRKTFLRSLNVNTYFILLYTVAVVVDGIYDLHIDTNDILIGYSVIVGKNLINHGINSVLNSKSGEMPVKQDPLTPTSKSPTNTVDRK
jgi:hypothetical protein